VSTDSNPLGLYIPQQTIEFADAPYLKPRDAEKWISNLPTAHVGETARLIYKAMAEINRVPLPASQRFKVLELFREPFDYVTQALQKHYINQAFPLSQKNQKIAELTKELQWELAIGYKIIIEASLSQKSGRVDNKVLLTAIYRAVSYLGESLLKSYLTYSPSSSQTWLEIHHLYLFSEHNSLITDTVKDSLNPVQLPNTIGTLYKNIVLLSLANPYRLAQSEILKVSRALQDWARYSHLHILDNPNNPIGLFAIDLENNAPPSYYNTSQKQINTNFIRILDTSELTRILRDKFDNSAEETENSIQYTRNNPNEISRDTLRRLILAWGAVPKRNFSRKGKEERIDVTLGLSATHCFIQKHYDEDQVENNSQPDEEFSDSQIAFQDKAHYDSEMIPSLNEPSAQPDVWDMANNPNLVSKQEFEFPPFSNVENKTSKPLLKPHDEIYDLYNCMLMNESAGGYCISWDNNQNTKTIVGALIGIKNSNNSNEDENGWSIGVIRWLKSLEDQGMFIGIELLSPSAQAIASKNISRNNENSEYTRSLLLPELLTVKQPQTIITQFLYKVGDNLELDVHGQPIKVKLTKLLESSSAFNQFEFSIIKAEKKAEQTDKNEKMKNFDSIWSSI